MDYFAEQIDEFPELSYIALVGEMKPDLDDEITSRVRRIRNASPQKQILALDVKGLRGLGPEHYDLFQAIQSNLQNFGWEFYICNIPTRFSNFFQSGRVQREFDVFSSKQDLLKTLAKNEEEEKNEQEAPSVNVKPIPVTVRTAEGVRLFEGQAEQIASDRIVMVYTDDHNASSFPSKSAHDLQLFFNSDVLQMPPPEVTLQGCEEPEDSGKNYRVRLELKQLDQQQETLLQEYFETELSQPA